MDRLKLVEIPVQLLHRLLSEGTPETRVVADPLPDDAVVVAVNSDGHTLTVIYRSDAFEDVAVGELIPSFTPKSRRVDA